MVLTFNTVLPVWHELSVAMFAGGALYTNLVEHPARMELPTEYAVTQWAPSFNRAARFQGSLAINGFVSGIANYYSGGSKTYLASGLCCGFILVWTLLGIMPTNRILLSLKTLEEKKDERYSGLLKKWNRLHAVRTLASITALALLVKEKLGL